MARLECAHGLIYNDPPSPSGGSGETNRRVRFQGHGHLGPLPWTSQHKPLGDCGCQIRCPRGDGCGRGGQGGGVQRTHAIFSLDHLVRLRGQTDFLVNSAN